MVSVFLLLVLQGVFGAECPFDSKNKQDNFASPPAYSPAVWSPPRVAEHTVLVQYMSEKMELHQVLWHTFGIVYDRTCSVEAVLERSLLNGNADGVFLSLQSEGSEILCGDRLSLRVCIECGIGVSWDALWKPLRIKHFWEMFPENEGKMWQVNPVGGVQPMCKREVRLWFPGGGIGATPYPVRGDIFTIIKEGSLRYAQIEEEKTEAFVCKVRALAEAKLRDLERAAACDGGKVTIRYVGPSGVRWAVWDGSAVVDKKGKTLGAFLRDLVLRGTSVGYVDESAEKNYAFVSASLCRVLRTTLAAHLRKGENVARLEKKPFLSAKDLRTIPFPSVFGWMVVPKDALRSPDQKYSLSLTFAGVTLEGVCFCVRLKSREGLEPRNYLWALDREALVKKKKKTCWYGELVASDRISWAF